jgi:flagellar L-ring protein precursor FlgH
MDRSFAQGNQPQYANPLFSDRKAFRVGDLLTVLVLEASSATNQATTTVDQNNQTTFRADASVTRGGGPSRFFPLFNGQMDNTFNGDAATVRSGTVTATLTVRVTDIDESGNLVIEGSRVVEVNDEKQTMTLSGVVRPIDIAPNNTVFSTKITDAQISYTGKGVVQTGHRPGFIIRFINWLF